MLYIKETYPIYTCLVYSNEHDIGNIVDKIYYLWLLLSALLLLALLLAVRMVAAEQNIIS